MSMQATKFRTTPAFIDRLSSVVSKVSFSFFRRGGLKPADNRTKESYVNAKNVFLLNLCFTLHEGAQIISGGGGGVG